MAASVAGMPALARGRPKGGAANQHALLLADEERNGGKDRIVEMGPGTDIALTHSHSPGRG